MNAGETPKVGEVEEMSDQISTKDLLIHACDKAIRMVETYHQIDPDESLASALKNYRKAKELLLATDDVSKVCRDDLPIYHLVRQVADGTSKAIKDWNDPIFYVMGDVCEWADKWLNESNGSGSR